MPQYDIQLHPDARERLDTADACYRDKIADTLTAVAQERKPTDHSRVEILQNNHNKKLYKIRVGDFRCLCELDKPRLLVLRIERREDAYTNINELYANL